METFKRNNPGNIRYNPANNWVGQIGKDGGFVVFDTPANGLRAMALLLYNYHKAGTDTIQKIVSKWAPATENPTAAYVSNVSRLTGIAPNQVLTAYQMPLVGAAMALQETGKQLSNDAKEALKTFYSKFAGISPVAAGIGSIGIAGITLVLYLLLSKK